MQTLWRANNYMLYISCNIANDEGFNRYRVVTCSQTGNYNVLPFQVRSGWQHTLCWLSLWPSLAPWNKHAHMHTHTHTHTHTHKHKVYMGSAAVILTRACRAELKLFSDRLLANSSTLHASIKYRNKLHLSKRAASKTKLRQEITAQHRSEPSKSADYLGGLSKSDVFSQEFEGCVPPSTVKPVLATTWVRGPPGKGTRFLWHGLFYIQNALYKMTTRLTRPGTTII